MGGWRQNRGASRRVKELLAEAGIPLEIQVLRICKRFAEQTDKRTLNHVSERGIPTYEGLAARAGRVVYAAKGEPLRELDCLLTVMDEYPVDASFGVQHIVEIPIACKQRKDVEVFGIDDPEIATTMLSFPIVSVLAGSQLAQQMGRLQVARLDHSVIATALVEIKQGRTPGKVHTENLIHNTGSSVYDFVETSTEEEGSLPWSADIFDLTKAFRKYLESHGYYWATVLHEWIRENVTTEQCTKFADNLRGSAGMTYYSIHSWLPVVCAGGPIHHAVAATSGEIGRFRKAKAFGVGLRLPGWRSFAGTSLVRRSAEAPVVVTNPEGLPSVLEAARDWFDAQKELLLGAEAELKQRALLEAAFVHAVRAQLGPDEHETRYRSDVDIMEIVRDW